VLGQRRAGCDMAPRRRRRATRHREALKAGSAAGNPRGRVAAKRRFVAQVCGINSNQSGLNATTEALVRLLGSINFENSLQVDSSRVNLSLPQRGLRGQGGVRWFGLLQLALATAGLKRRALHSGATHSTHAADEDGLPTHLCVRLKLARHRHGTQYDYAAPLPRCAAGSLLLLHALPLGEGKPWEDLSCVATVATGVWSLMTLGDPRGGGGGGVADV
jgi:hypothetical protein